MFNIFLFLFFSWKVLRVWYCPRLSIRYRKSSSASKKKSESPSWSNSPNDTVKQNSTHITQENNINTHSNNLQNVCVFFLSLGRLRQASESGRRQAEERLRKNYKKKPKCKHEKLQKICSTNVMFVGLTYLVCCCFQVIEKTKCSDRLWAYIKLPSIPTSK